MLETMYEAPGIGLAATQVDVQKRIIVIDISEDKSQALVLINPEIIKQEGEREHEEGCLSVPEAYEMVTRADKIRVTALDRDGKKWNLMLMTYWPPASNMKLITWKVNYLLIT